MSSQPKVNSMFKDDVDTPIMSRETSVNHERNARSYHGKSFSKMTAKQTNQAFKALKRKQGK